MLYLLQVPGREGVADVDGVEHGVQTDGRGGLVLGLELGQRRRLDSFIPGRQVGTPLHNTLHCTPGRYSVSQPTLALLGSHSHNPEITVVRVVAGCPESGHGPAVVQYCLVL